MTLKQLENIIALRGEIAQLNKSMEKHYKAGDMVGDYYYAPNSGSVRTFHGIAVKDEPVLARKKERLRAKVADLQAQVEAAERFIDEIPDTNIRVLVRAYVIDGATYGSAAKLVHKKMSESTARKSVKAYFDSL